jgi:hypothetical protein
MAHTTLAAMQMGSTPAFVDAADATANAPAPAI